MRITRILDRYIFSEFLLYFILGVTVAVIFQMVNTVLFQMMDFIIDKKVPFAVFMKIIFYQIPWYAVIALPMATVFTTLITINRMSKDSEIDVLRTSGVSVVRMMAPMLFAGLLVSAVSFVMMQKLVPWSYNRSIVLWREYLLSETSGMPTADLFFKGKGNRQIYIKLYDPKTRIASDVTIYEVSDAAYPVVTTARTGVWTDKYLILKNGTLHHFNRDGLIDYEASFADLKINIERELEEIFGVQKTSQEMTIRELKEKIAIYKNSGIETKSLETDLQFKFSIPVASFMFVLLGFPLSIRTGRSNVLAGLLIAVSLMIVFWVGIIAFTALGKKGVLPPMAAAWTQNAIFLIIGLGLLIRTRK
jgi:lipopolysaccharide export system permease protein